MQDLRIFLTEKATLPVRDDGSSGYDLTATEILHDGPDFLEYGTGIHIELPEGMEGQLRARSSISKYDLILANGVGTIDSSYRGEIRVRFKKTIPVCSHSKNKTLSKVKMSEDFIFECKYYEIGDRVAQIVIAPVALPALVPVEKLEDLTQTARGSGGFGSTGR